MRSPALRHRRLHGADLTALGLRPGLSRDLANEGDIRVVVEDFFAKAERDPLLSATFASAKTDAKGFVAAMSGFWSSLLFRHGSYRGQPCHKHEALDLEKIHFERWSELFSEAVDAHFSGPSADELKNWATRVGEVFEGQLTPAPLAL